MDLSQLRCAHKFFPGIGQGAGGKGTNFYICDKSTTNQKEVERAFLDFTEVRKDIAILLITQGVAQHIRHLVDAHTAAVSLPFTSLLFTAATCLWHRDLHSASRIGPLNFRNSF